MKKLEKRLNVQGDQDHRVLLVLKEKKKRTKKKKKKLLVCDK